MLAALALGAATFSVSGDAASLDRAAAAAARVRPQLEADFAQAGLRYGAPVFIRIFKAEAELELFVLDETASPQRYRLFRTYPVCTFSGTLGPKTKQGDRQAPEGFYDVTPRQLNPASQFHLSFNLGYPNAYERARGYTGDFLMVHGNCVSIGCYAMTDAGIEPIYTLVAAALAGGQKSVPVHAFPFRMTEARRADVETSPWRAFWENLAMGYELFERTGMPPRVSVRDGNYVFDA